MVIEQLNAFQSLTEELGETTESELRGKGSAGADFIFAKGSSELGAARKSGRANSKSSSRSTSARVAAIRALSSARLPLVVDDFHYLPKTLQGSVVRALKTPIFDGVPVVIIAIPHRRYDAVKVEKEMTGRILPISIPSWTSAELAYIPKTGFPLLGRTISERLTTHLANEAIGSPHLMQEFCRAISRAYESSEGTISLNTDETKDIFTEVANTIGRPIFEKLARGPRQRSDRVRRKLVDGKEVDIYELVLYGLAKLNPGLNTYEYEDLRSGIRDVSAGAIPQLHEVARVLKNMADIASTDESSTPVIDFEEEDKRLHVTDPFFAFFLRQGDLSRQ